MIIQYYRNQTPPANLISDRLGTFKPLRMTVAVGHPGREMAEMSLDAQGAVQGGIPKAAEDQPNSGAQDWLSSIEKSNLTPRYYLTIGLLVLIARTIEDVVWPALIVAVIAVLLIQPAALSRR